MSERTKAGSDTIPAECNSCLTKDDTCPFCQKPSWRGALHDICYEEVDRLTHLYMCM